MIRSALVGVLLIASPAAAQGLPGAAEGAAMSDVLRALQVDDWAGARGLAARIPDSAAASLATWRWLSRENAPFADYAAFIAEHGDWPGIDRLRRRAEAAMPATLPPQRVIDFFAATPPHTGVGALRHAEALRAAGRSDEARATAVRAWTTRSLERADEDALIAGFAQALAGSHVARLDMLLWRGLTDEAARMLPRVDAGTAALARARIALRKGEVDGVTALINRVPANLSDHPGLAYERFRWRAARGLADGAEEMILTTSRAGAAGLGRPDVWADRRRGMARNAARDGRASVAYELASRHGLTASDGYAHADLEWIAGWVALRQLRDPERAEGHFARFTAAVGSPISLGRGHYWLGRAREAKGDAAGARASYTEAARWQTSFYGQLAAARIGAAPSPDLVGADAPTDWQRAAIIGTPLVRAGVMVHHAGDLSLSNQLLVHAARNASGPRDFAALAALALSLDRPEIAVRVAKAAANTGLVLPTAYYPITGLARASGRVDPAFAMAIARQESELDPSAISPAGARGLMQVMPATAEQVARKLGLAYSRAALTDDWAYNARLGTDYLAGLMTQFDSVPLAAAGYNAGPGRVREWLGRFGDPRGRPIDEVVDWLEHIPFNETRNYVQRVMEGKAIYEARIAGRSVPLLTADRLR